MPRSLRIVYLTVTVIAGSVGLDCLAVEEGKAAATEAALAIQGEYTGTIAGRQGAKKLAVQVVALGNDNFRAVGYTGGLPGDGWDGSDKEEVTATAVDGVVEFKGQIADSVLSAGVLQISSKDGKHLGDLNRVIRRSPTLGAAPPAGAVVLFDGTSADRFVRSRGRGAALMTDTGLLVHGADSKQRFGNHRLHIEFRLPFEPANRGQRRGNSGCYVQGRYEVQMLDSFGLIGLDNECGGIYQIAAPRVNMCLPPMSWQTYDIEFTAAQHDSNGKKSKNARITVRHNGVLIHDYQELPKRTLGSPLQEGPEPGFLHLQDHGNAVRYRNIWVVEQ